MSDTSGMAFIVVPHLDPTHPSHMDAVLQRFTDMQVMTAEHDQRIEPNAVYVTPPNRYLTLNKGRIRLTRPQDARGHRRPIDMFFHGLGADLKERAIAIILSGTGSDGASGLRTIKGEGGFVMVEDPASAEYPDMPQAAIDTGLVDTVLGHEDLPAALLRVAQHPYITQPDSDAVAFEEEQVATLLTQLKQKTQHDFRSYKKSTIQRRIHRRMGMKAITSVSDYVNVILNDAEEAQALAQDFMIMVTGFFRDPQAWEMLNERVLKPLVENRKANESVRIWVPGCATGEEAYSIGMLLLEQMDAAGKQLDVKIFASDTTNSGLEFARNGVFHASAVSELPEHMLKRYFHGEADTCRVSKQLRGLIIFAPHNVLQTPPFTRIDLLSCRNLLIYLEQSVQQRLQRLFHFALKPDGHLFLGSAESITGLENLFEPVSKKHRIFRRIGISRHADLDFPVIGGYNRVGTGLHDVESKALKRKLADVVRDVLVSIYAPAAVVTDRHFKIHHFHGETDPYLRQPAGEPTSDLMAMVREGLRGEIRAIVKKAFSDNKVESAHARLRRGQTTQAVKIEARPMSGAHGESGLLMLTFEPAEEVAREAPAPAAEDREEREIDALEHENTRLREELRSTVEQLESLNEELKASNEEILSMNEELQSSNEELETSKEELQSFNEELNTVNAELQEKIEDLEQTTNDLDNLLNSTDIATLFLDRQQNIRRFTPAMKSLMDLIPADIGRPVGNLTHRFKDQAVSEDAKQALKALVPVAKEIRSSAGNWYMRRTLPYRTRDDRIDGVVITFTDITQAKQVEKKLRAERDYAERIIETVGHPLVVLSPDLKVQMANGAFFQTFLPGDEDTVGKRIYDLGNGQWDIPQLRHLLGEVLPRQESFDDFEVQHDFPDIGHRVMLVSGRQLSDIQLILLAFEDITERNRNEEHRETLVAELNHRVKNLLMTVQAVAGQTLRSSDDLAGFEEAFLGRLGALARGHEMLMQANWRPTQLTDVIAWSLDPYMSSGKKRFRVERTDMLTTAHAAIAFDFILHELATNSAKYGALSDSKGLVNISCNAHGKNTENPKLIWLETRGPKIGSPPKEKGFGTQLIERCASHDLDGQASFDYRSEGLCCTIEFSRTHIAGRGEL